MCKFIISVKDKTTGRDLIPPYIIDSLDGFFDYVEKAAALGCIVVVDSLKKEDSFVELKK